MAAFLTNCVRERGQVTGSTCWLTPATGNSGNGGLRGGGLGAGGGGERGRDDERSCGKVRTCCASHVAPGRLFSGSALDGNVLKSTVQKPATYCVSITCQRKRWKSVRSI